MESKLIRLDGCCDFYEGTRKLSAATFFGFSGGRMLIGKPKGVTRPSGMQFMGIPMLSRDGDTGVFALSICAVHDKLIPKYSKYDYRNQNRERLEERMRIKLEAFAKRFNLTFYSEVRENFSTWEAIAQAEAGGFAGVIVEDLS